MNDCCTSHQHDEHDHGQDNSQQHIGLLIALAMLITVLVLDYGFQLKLDEPISLSINAAAYLLAGWDVLVLAFKKAVRGDIFNEFVLMSVATLGAFYIGEYAEGVAVMVFYSIGEWFQDSAVDRAKASIKALLDIRPDQVTVIRDGEAVLVHATEVKLEEIMQLKPGERVGLDGIMISERSSFNTAALTGESKPDHKYRGEKVLAGMINLNTVAEIKVTALFKDSKLSKILEMVQDASSRKSQTQLFISRFAKVYTPIVFFMALALLLIPSLFVDIYVFNDWLYRSLVFLVISCPCALVVSIPLGYFGGIGLASRNGILFKGGNFLDVMTKIDTVVMDKTGTLTKGVFKVQEVVAVNIDKEELVKLVALLERNSTHPIAQAIIDSAGTLVEEEKYTAVEEIAGHGLKGNLGTKVVLAGNSRLLKKYGVPYPPEVDVTGSTVVLVAIDERYVGYITIADELKEDVVATVKQLHALRIKTVMLSGDKQTVVDEVAKKLGITAAFGGLLPEDKVTALTRLKNEGRQVAFVGDGINDAPVLALADVGIAMGGLGSDAAIETADIVIQNDQVLKIVTAIKIGKLTRNIVWQNIALAMGVKVLVLSFGAFGVANLWEAVIADVGVAFLAILNAVRIQRMKLS
ncbi:heavy metal translocating P-type ATPase [Pedobacter insulae]|uniref:P-type Zn(2+) transporter n=1 Tax=Pedobacter insulae TaxID=414048 RepID=A0A1I2ZAD8_9SPHI|nr:heavy metal translocating P-type ATPase [Pedobacter insulae]SFH34807.1 Cd2+/Zn2+-exporting ATPase [Pedobacter insulae]